MLLVKTVSGEVLLVKIVSGEVLLVNAVSDEVLLVKTVSGECCECKVSNCMACPYGLARSPLLLGSGLIGPVVNFLELKSQHKPQNRLREDHRRA